MQFFNSPIRRTFKPRACLDFGCCPAKPFWPAKLWCKNLPPRFAAHGLENELSIGSLCSVLPNHGSHPNAASAHGQWPKIGLAPAGLHPNTLYCTTGRFFCWTILDNPADQLVTLVNSNRTASKASSLSDNQGLGCIALQYIKAYEGQCSDVHDKKPMESSFTDKFAPDCGVQVATLSKITGRLVACQSKYPSPAEALDILVNDAKGLQVLHSKNHTEIGAAVSGTDGGGPYFWCVLFSDGKPATSFKVDGEVPKTAMHPGCFSGNNDDCAGPTNGAISTNTGTSKLVVALLFVIACAFAL